MNRIADLGGRVKHWLFQPIDILPLIYLRMIFGVIMLLDVSLYREEIAALYIEPDFHFRYYGFEWVHPLAGDGMYYVFALMAVLAICILIGFMYRLSTILFFITISYIFLIDQTYYLNHAYLVILLSFLLIFVPANRAYAVDSWLRPKLRRQVIPAWTLWIFLFQIGIVYFFGGIAKLNPDWLTRAEPMHTWLSRRTDFPIIGQLFTEQWMAFFFSYSGLMIDLCTFPLLLWRRTRIPMTIILVMFHLLNFQLFNIGIFPWLMLATLPLFYPLGRTTAVVAYERLSSPPKGKRAYWVMGILGVYVLIQVLLPLRHWLYAGDVAWTDEGHRYAWRMKLRSKDGEIHFYVTDYGEDTRWEVDLGDYLTFAQIDDMMARPDMIVQFAHHIGDELEDAGYDTDDYAVHVLAIVALNYNEYYLLIDPEVNMAQADRPLLHPATWIMPYGQPASFQLLREMLID